MVKKLYISIVRIDYEVVIQLFGHLFVLKTRGKLPKVWKLSPNVDDLSLPTPTSTKYTHRFSHLGTFKSFSHTHWFN